MSAKTKYKCALNTITYSTDPLAIKATLVDRYGGPVEMAYDVYDDFFSYFYGTYQRTPTSTYVGSHAIKVIGYGIDSDNVAYWLC